MLNLLRSNTRLLLLLFASIFLDACRHHEPLLEPQTASVPPAVLAKIQAWYNPKIERLRSQKTSAQSIYLPQWGEGKIETLPTGERIAYFPAHRQANVQYHQIGFVRRFVVRLDAQDKVLEVKLLEMIGKKEYLRAEKDQVVSRFYRQNMGGMKAVAWERTLDFATNKIGMMPTCEPIIIYKTFENGCSSIVTIYCDGSKSESTPICGGYFNPTDGNGVVGTGGGTSREGQGSGGTVSSPCPLCPNFDNGDNTSNAPTPKPPHKYSAALLKIADTTRMDKNDPDLAELDNEFQRLYQESCLFKCMIDKMSEAQNPNDNTKKLRIAFFTDADLRHNGDRIAGRYYPIALSIGIHKNAIVGPSFSNVLAEELFHSYQDAFDGGSYRNIPSDGTGTPNIEFESKLFSDIDNYCYGRAKGIPLHNQAYWGNWKKKDDSYIAYLKAVTLGGTKRPSSVSEMNPTGFSYQTQLEKFKLVFAGTPYDKPINYTKNPTALLNLVSNCNCN